MKKIDLSILLPEPIFEWIKEVSDSHDLVLSDFLPFLLLLGIETFGRETQDYEAEDPDDGFYE